MKQSLCVGRMNSLSRRWCYEHLPLVEQHLPIGFEETVCFLHLVQYFSTEFGFMREWIFRILNIAASAIFLKFLLANFLQNLIVSLCVGLFSFILLLLHAFFRGEALHKKAAVFH